LTFLSLFRSELADRWRQLVVLSLLSGVSNAAILATISNASAAPHQGSTGSALIVFALCIIIYNIAQKALMIQATTLAEGTVNGIRVRFMERLQSANLKDVETLDRSEIYAAVSGEMQVLSDGALNLIVVVQALVLLTLTMIYLAFLSLTAVALAVLFIAIATSIHLRRERQIRDQMHTTFQLETQMVQGFTDFLEGFKELKLNAARSTELASSLRRLSLQVAQARTQIRSLFATDSVASQIAFFLLIGIMVFLVPRLGNIDRETIVKLTASSLFLIGPISTVVAVLPVVQRVNAAAESILMVQNRLSKLTQFEAASVPAFTTFSRITLDGVVFRYDSSDERGFQLGPIDMEIRAGQVLFITGGNGSGKSTLLKLITGLYLPTEGTIRLDGQPIGRDNVTRYRELFSAIFSDNHLFRQLYGIHRIDPEEVDRLFRLLEMENKTRIVDRAFDTIALSSGQRKRLALIALLLEHRPVCLFDEWAADQDPQFREKFYRTIIPDLRGQGKTIIAATHDERYFATADLLIRLEEGQLQAVALAPNDVGPR
jgi:putative ATP-binding cassette transporter